MAYRVLIKIVCYILVCKKLPAIYYRKISEYFRINATIATITITNRNSIWNNATTITNKSSIWNNATTFDIVDAIIKKATDMKTDNPVIFLTNEEYNWIKSTRLTPTTITTILEFILQNNYMNIQFKLV